MVINLDKISPLAQSYSLGDDQLIHSHVAQPPESKKGLKTKKGLRKTPRMWVLLTGNGRVDNAT
jgi:hypothetical protein